MARTIRWGVIASTGIAKRRTIPEGIVPASNAELVAVFSRNQKANADIAKQFNAKPADSIDALLAEKIDAVYIASPPGAHREQAIACAGAGKHVLCEKPLGLAVDDAEAMVAACKRSNVLLGSALM